MRSGLVSRTGHEAAESMEIASNHGYRSRQPNHTQAYAKAFKQHPRTQAPPTPQH